MGAMNGTPANAAAKPDKYAILNQVKDINGGISSIDSNLAKLRTLQQRSLDDPDTSENSRTNRELDSLNASTMTTYRNLVTRVTKIKQDPSSGDPMNKDQVGNCDRRLKQAIRDYQMAEAAFQKRLQDQMRRQYLIVKPDASEQEVEQVVNDTNGNTQIFSQALMQSDRRGQSQTALRNVESRHAAIQRIEKQMIELAQLFEQMNVLVEQQEVVVEQVEQRGNETVENVEKANGELTGAVTHARNAKRLKWWCLGITILIILIVVAGVVGWYYTVGPGKVMSTVNNGGRRLVKREPAAAGPAGPAGAAFGTNHRRLPDSSFPAGWKGQGSKTGGSPGAQKLRRRTVDREDVMSMGVHALGQMAGHYLA